MINCPSCNKQLSEEDNFCAGCGKRAKCSKCGKQLQMGDKFCGGCGNLVSSSENSSESNNSGEELTTAINVITYDEDTRSRHFDARLTDKAFESGSEAIGLFLAVRLNNPIKRVRPSNSGDDTDIQPNLAFIDVERNQPDQPDSTYNPVIPKEISTGSEESQLKDIFKANGNELRLINSRIKQKSQKDFVERVCILFLYAHEMAGRESISRDALKALLEDAKVYDGNSRGWLINSDLVARDGDFFGLSVPGREKVKDVLREIHDTNIGTVWSVGTKGSPRSSRSNKTKEVDTNAESEKPGKSRKARGSSYRAQVKKLCSDGFFSAPRTGAETRAELVRIGYPFELKRITESLVALLKSKKLNREKNSADEWAYINK